ncbi:MAG: adenylosuccinate synthase [Candidatus Thorarchaeota archaeon]|jgi:adenylosuccinate synthase
MQNLVVVGLQYGDEGKGKIVDYLSEHFDIVARFQGGSNAGHTVIVDEDEYRFRIMPTGAVRNKTAVIGNGVVIDPQILLNEVKALSDCGVEVDLKISDRAHIITSFHLQIDGFQEMAKGVSKIGTTKRGIGPTYSDKVSRIGMRVCDFVKSSTSDRWSYLATISESRIEKIYGANLESSQDNQRSKYNEMMVELGKYVTDTGEFLENAMKSGRKVLFEGAQGALLDIDHGTYPYVTSSNCTSAAAATGTGVSPMRLDSVLGICKAYLTRVGTGPFPTELNDKTGEMMRQRGHEFGTVTGRPRRCGWLDLIALRYAIRLNGSKYLALTKLDVLSNFQKLKVCTAYSINDAEVHTVPASADEYSKATPVYQEMDGWSEPSGGSWAPLVDEGFKSLPNGMKSFIELVEEFTETKVAIVSLGPERSETVIIPGVFPELP